MFSTSSTRAEENPVPISLASARERLLRIRTFGPHNLHEIGQDVSSEETIFSTYNVAGVRVSISDAFAPGNRHCASNTQEADRSTSQCRARAKSADIWYNGRTRVHRLERRGLNVLQYEG
jgi:hypothetical protein